MMLTGARCDGDDNIAKGCDFGRPHPAKTIGDTFPPTRSNLIGIPSSGYSFVCTNYKCLNPKLKREGNWKATAPVNFGRFTIQCRFYVHTYACRYHKCGWLVGLGVDLEQVQQ